MPSTSKREAQNHPTRIGSPYAEGGGGVTFEHRVGAVCLYWLITGAAVEQLGELPPQSVAFQQKPESAVDDITVTSESDPKTRLSVACRRRPLFTRSNEKTRRLFVSLVRADLAAEDSSDIEERFAIAVSGHQGGAREVAELAALAKNQSDAAAYMSLVNEPGRFTAKLRERLSHLMDLVGNALSSISASDDIGSIDHRCWSLLRRLNILDLEVEPPSEGDWAALVDSLKPWCRDGTTESARALRNELESLAGEYAQTAAAVDANTVRRRLHNCINPTAHQYSVGWKRLLLLDKEARAAVPRVLTGPGDRPGLRLERAEVREKLSEALHEGGDLVVAGASGVGKSAAVLDAVEPSVLAADCQALVFNLRHLPGTLLGFVNALSEPLEELLAGMTAPSRLLIVDAAEAVAESRRDVFEHILRSARCSEVSVVAVAAPSGASVAAELMRAGGIGVREHEVPPLSDDEIPAIASYFPELERLAQNPKGRELLRRPIVVDLLARAGNPGVPLCDAEALDHIWKELIRNGERQDAGLPDAREDAMLSLAAQMLTGGLTDTILSALDPASVAGLRHRGLLGPVSQLPWERTPKFAHDLIRDYAIARQLLATHDAAGELARSNAPRWALPAARLACEIVLSGADTSADPLCGRFRHLQASFDGLAAAGHGGRWADVPTEAMLKVADPLPVLRNAWGLLLSDKAKGLHRLLRILKQWRNRDGVLDPTVAEPVIELLLVEGTPEGLGEEASGLIRDWLTAHILRRTPAGHPIRLARAQAIAERCAKREHDLDRRDAEAAAARAQRSPEEVADDAAQERHVAALAGISMDQMRSDRARRRAHEWIDDASVAHLALLGPDLGSTGEAILRKIAGDDPQSLAPAVETPLAGQSLAEFAPSLLVDLAEAYYLDDREVGYIGLLDDGIRRHTGGGLGPLFAYYRGPFVAMFRSDFRGGVACLNRLLNHAARHRVRALRDLHDRQAAGDETDTYGRRLSITGESRTYVGDDHVWRWYRGTAVGPYPCMSALQALELVTDEITSAGVPIARLVSVLLKDADSLAMPGLVLGMLLRHLENAGDALEPFLVEPTVWELEFTRCVHEHSGLAADVPGLVGLDRRSWSLREASMMLALRADDQRAEQLCRLGEQLVSTAARRVGADTSHAAREHLAAVRNWATALDRSAYQLEEHDGQLLIKQTTDPEVEAALGETNADLLRGNKALGLVARHAHTRENGGRAPNMPSEALAADLAMARDLLANPPNAALGRSPDGPVAVAASTIELHFDRGVDVSEEDLQWSAAVLLRVAVEVSEHPSDIDDNSIFNQGIDRSAGRALPYLLLPAAADLRQLLEINSAEDLQELISLNAAIACRSSNEGRLAYARALDNVWSTSCSRDLDGRCHHEVAHGTVEASFRDCVLGPWDNNLQRRAIVQLDDPAGSSLAAIAGDDIITRRLSAAIRALGAAAISTACCREAAQETLSILLEAHCLSMVAHEYGFQFSESDSLIAARAALWQAMDDRDAPLLHYVRAYLGDPRMLTESLRSINVAAEERPDAAAAARRLWPILMELVLDTVERNPDLLAVRYWGNSSLARLLPSPAHAQGYFTLEMAGEPERWRDLLAWSSQVERWLGVAAGSHECIDALVDAIRELDVSDQIEIGLGWIEQIVQKSGNQCANTFGLPRWLREREMDLLTPQQQDRWQRVVDRLVVAGETRLSDLVD